MLHILTLTRNCASVHLIVFHYRLHQINLRKINLSKTNTSHIQFYLLLDHWVALIYFYSCYLGKLPGLKCTHLVPTEKNVHSKKRYLCHDKDAPYNFVWYRRPEDIQRDKDFDCMKFTGFDNGESYLCNRKELLNINTP